MALEKPQFIRIIEEALEEEPGAIHGDELLEALDCWDSLATVSLIAALDEELNVAMPPKSMAAAETVDDLFEIASTLVSGRPTR